MPLAPGDDALPGDDLRPRHDVRVAMTKWGSRPHWAFDAVLLGSDEHGDWLGLERGTRLTRPGATYVAPTDQVVLVPGAAPAPERGWIATFHARGGPVRVYIDITTPPVWDGRTVRAVDLDLDVLAGWSGRAWVDDEDEFAEHRVSLGYPDAVVRAALESCARVHHRVAEQLAPYHGIADAWLARLAS